MRIDLKSISKQIKRYNSEKMSDDEAADLLINLKLLEDEVKLYKSKITEDLLNSETFENRYNLTEQMKVTLGNENSKTIINTKKVYNDVKEDKTLLSDFLKATSLVKKNASVKLVEIIEKHSKVEPGAENCVIKVGKITKKELIEIAKVDK